MRKLDLGEVGGGNSKIRYVTEGGESKRYVSLGEEEGFQKHPKSSLRNFWTAPLIKTNFRLTEN